MRIDLYGESGRRVARAYADLNSPPAAITTRAPDGAAHEHFLDWNQALDDEGRLRKCPACNCEDLYVLRTFPPITGFVLVLLIGLLCFGLYGLVSVNPVPLFITGGVLIAANLAFMCLSPRFLTCYRCSARYHQAGISRNRQGWDIAIATRYKKLDNPESLFMWSMIVLGGLISLIFAVVAYLY